MTNLLACPSPPRRDAQMTIYPGVGHDSWTKAYDDPELYRWLLSHRRGHATTQPAK